MAKPMILDEYAVAGFGGAKNENLYSSPAWYAHELGAFLALTGRASPSDVRMGRGYSVRCRDMVFKAVEGKGMMALTFERVS
jgi:hypothetical protein